jgi:hypothetical protein
MKMGMGFPLPDISNLPGPSRPGGDIPVDPTAPTNFIELQLSAFLTQLENSSFVIGLEN